MKGILLFCKTSMKKVSANLHKGSCAFFFFFKAEKGSAFRGVLGFSKTVGI